jgi:ATP-binding protein involved in chromosome partitioning
MSITDVKNIILVSSAKGGVGKSTATANIAAALNQLGFRVGVIDADIYGPSQNKMFGVTTSDITAYNTPTEKFGIKINSIASRIEDERAIAWRGPMLKVAVMDLIFDTEWGILDYLVVDMPPGTGDIQLSICEKLSNSRAVIVTTPQEVATLDTERGINLYKNSDIELIGIIENMSGYVCQHCGQIEYIFGQSGGEILANKYNIPLLAKVPIETNIRKCGDTGTPIVLYDRVSSISKIYLDVAEKIKVHSEQTHIYDT